MYICRHRDSQKNKIQMDQCKSVASIDIGKIQVAKTMIILKNRKDTSIEAPLTVTY